ncbi:MAG TPA: MBL fold metallo-hydrolase [Candidatus Binataceae bacterium]|jgi:glyoxylase-like metal-dependent hydrolase (beta-lactamase superfamily II)|nr:MBL fold metallo-hydrolase [Candidatus Binataceae bacterium]
METPPRLQIGEFTIAFLTDGLWRNDGGCMFGVVPRELWQRAHPPDEQNRIRLNLTCPLILKGSQAILVDTGIGNRLRPVERRIFDHGDGWLLDGLAKIGMEPGDITHVLLSHLHFDHCGGIIRMRQSGVAEPAFPRARVMVQQGEVEVARHSSNERLRAAYRHIEECLTPLGGLLEPIRGDTELVPGVTARVTGGHTYDHQIVIVESSGQAFAHLADIVPTRSHMRGPWNQAFDLDALTTMEQKAQYLGRAVDGRWWISFAHDDTAYAARPINEHGRLSLGESLTVAHPSGT